MIEQKASQKIPSQQTYQQTQSEVDRPQTIEKDTTEESDEDDEDTVEIDKVEIVDQKLRGRQNTTTVKQQMDKSSLVKQVGAKGVRGLRHSMAAIPQSKVQNQEPFFGNRKSSQQTREELSKHVQKHIQEQQKFSSANRVSSKSRDGSGGAVNRIKQAVIDNNYANQPNTSIQLGSITRQSQKIVSRANNHKLKNSGRKMANSSHLLETSNTFTNGLHRGADSLEIIQQFSDQEPTKAILSESMKLSVTQLPHVANKIQKHNVSNTNAKNKEEYQADRYSPVSLGSALKPREGSNYSAKRSGYSNNDYHIHGGHLVPTKQNSGVMSENDKRNKNMNLQGNAPYSDIGVSQFETQSFNSQSIGVFSNRQYPENIPINKISLAQSKQSNSTVPYKQNNSILVQSKPGTKSTTLSDNQSYAMAATNVESPLPNNQVGVIKKGKVSENAMRALQSHSKSKEKQPEQLSALKSAYDIKQ